ncbi:homogentisate 1,2-dioxygenase [Rhinocladiella mackenziei CBS 650.93]|uniref:homogentisate 1,2-dioxygenase n=1 Tax=Rhinocladiella mackenziei CBS 650.93 TaxID=1442369 RepID=A0A0D2H3Z6_9EURO|nr:homogentisate 1,2-dioxygenase [Rhinocladiella mackenziei CBS 650.93]KIX05123.1 homogentisate 1,2-dioxygenase [Rhinocladiella mackenziei CBS 650.93]
MPVTQFTVPERYKYQTGFLANLETEAIPNALPIGQNSPQKCPYGLYAEKISGTSFTAPRWENQQTWVYRIIPSAAHADFKPETSGGRFEAKFNHIPNQLRWDPFDLAGDEVDWIGGLNMVAGAGDVSLKQGVAYYIYAVNKSMPSKTAFYSADGDMLIVPQTGAMDIQTEMGRLLVRPNEICVIPRGIRYRVDLVDEDSPLRGYILELYQGHFQLPELGPIGSNCLANARDFQIPVASFEHDTNSQWKVYNKFCGQLFSAKQSHTPFDVVAWEGRYYPYKYDLGRFNTIGTISYDHPDPSLNTVLTATTGAHPGTAIADFVIFPPRWLVAEDTFRPPSYHRNVMSEFMGLISGSYIAKGGGTGGFQAAGASLHNCMSSHGPDTAAFERASNEELKPVKVGVGSMAFMFESCYMVGVTDWGLTKCQKLQANYSDESWVGLKDLFRPPDSSSLVVNGSNK